MKLSELPKPIERTVVPGNEQVYEAILSLAASGFGLLLDEDQASQLLIFPSGEKFRLDRAGVTRLD